MSDGLVSAVLREWVVLRESVEICSTLPQAAIEGRLERRRKGVLGPPYGVRAIVFIDDLNMPSKEEHGAQPPIELLRQCADQVLSSCAIAMRATAMRWLRDCYVTDMRLLRDCFVIATCRPGAAK